MEYWKQVDFCTTFSMQKDIFTHKLFEESLINNNNLRSNYWTVKKWSAIYHRNTQEQHAIFSLVVDQFLLKWAAINGRHCKQLCGWMEFLLNRSIETIKSSLKSVNLCKFTAWCTDVLVDMPHPQFYTKVLSKKVRLICRCLR